VSEVRVATYVHDPDRPDHRVRAQGRRRARTGAAAASASGRSNVVGCRSCSGRTEGLNVPMREIARRAWGPPRHPVPPLPGQGFTGHRGLHGFCLVFEKICELHARSRGFTAAFMSAFPNAMDRAASRELRAANTRCARSPTGPPRQGRRPPALRLLTGRSDPHTYGQQRHPRHLTGRRSRGIAALRRARDPGISSIPGGLAAPVSSTAGVRGLDPLTQPNRRNGLVMEGLKLKAILPERRPRAVPDQAHPPAAVAAMMLA